MLSSPQTRRTIPFSTAALALNSTFPPMVERRSPQLLHSVRLLHQARLSSIPISLAMFGYQLTLVSSTRRTLVPLSLLYPVSALHGPLLSVLRLHQEDIPHYLPLLTLGSSDTSGQTTKARTGFRSTMQHMDLARRAQMSLPPTPEYTAGERVFPSWAKYVF